MSLIDDLSQYSLVTLNDLPLVYTIGDFNNANITPLLREFKLLTLRTKHGYTSVPYLKVVVRSGKIKDTVHSSF
jgi:hypothetical protein